MRLYSGTSDLRAMQALTQRLGPRDARWHIGELVWYRYATLPPAAPGRAPEDLDRDPSLPTALWERDGEIAAWAWVDRPAELSLHHDPAYPELVDEILRWFDETAQGDRRTVTVLDAETDLIDALRRHGYREETGTGDEEGHHDEDPFFIHLRRDLAGLPEPVVPAGYTLRPVRDERDAAVRAAAHRAAFSRPDAPSKVTEASYARMMGIWPYRTDLDWLVEASDGTPVAFCLVWPDEHNREAVLEPVGTDPGHRRLGLASAAILGALHTARGLGMETARVAARGDEAYPSARATYRSLGFRRTGRNVDFVR
ncbi:GNAT family N-acetyltransferase [Actinomadura sp. 9N407]|uniref:GNAT family N-acetyltransferase n=1 Tax=Actinomadura sp. 9N407 TaxID=3375154 RepID=UPI003792D38D